MDYEFEVVDTAMPTNLNAHLTASKCWYDCMSGGKRSKHMRIDVDDCGMGIIGISSAWPLQHPKGDFKSSYYRLRELTLHPAVLALVGKEGSYGIHVRSVVADAAIQKAGVATTDEALHALVMYQGVKVAHTTVLNRGHSVWEQFVSGVRELGEGKTFYISADNGEAVGGFVGVFGEERFRYLTPPNREQGNDAVRGVEDVQYALGDMINLGRCGVIMGSSGSSFTEVAAAFGKGEGKTVVKTVGVDFGRSFCRSGGTGDIDEVGSEGVLRYLASKVAGVRSTVGDEVVFKRQDMEDYQQRIMTELEEIVMKDGVWPSMPDGETRGDGYFHEGWVSGADYKVRSVYLPIPWGYATHVDDAMLLRIGEFWEQRVDGKFPHFTVMVGVNVNYVNAKLKQLGGKEIVFAEVVVFGTMGTKKGVEFPIPDVVGEDRVGEMQFEERTGVVFDGDCGSVMRCGASRIFDVGECMEGRKLAASKEVYGRAKVGVVLAGATPHGSDFSAVVQAGAVPVIVYDR